MNKNKLYMFLLILLLVFPVFVFAYDKVYLGGENIGIEVNSKGVLVVGFYKVNGKNIGKDSGLEIGDSIIKIDNKYIESANDIHELSSSSLNITYIRDGKEYETTLNFEKEDDVYKSGLYIKDKVVGIGTLTFIVPDTLIYGALGHQINESTTGQKFEIKDGNIFKTEVTDVERSEENSPGEKNAKYYTEDIYGNVIKNTKTGIYGKYTNDLNDKKLISVSDNIKLGKAYIRTVLNKDKEEDFEINILKINENDLTRNILFEITDENLLSKTGGIVQGMSGSPIIQDNNIVGAVTHVVVDNPTKGYGILISNMLKDAN